jgi:hypothetical protein
MCGGRGSLLVVRDRRPPSILVKLGIEVASPPYFSFASMPIVTPWVVHCSSKGLSVAFGAFISGEVSEGSGDVGPVSVVSLTDAPLSAERCAELVVSVGEAVTEIVGKDAGSRP